MTKSELISLISAKNSKLTAKQVELGINSLINSIISSLVKGKRVEIRGFGSFNLNYRRPRKGRNPKTGEILQLPGKFAPHFKPGKELREVVNS